MDGLGQYIISIVTAALIIGMLCGIVHNSFGKELLKLLCGLFLTLSAIRPIANINFSEITDYMLPYTEDAALNISIGESMADEAINDIIKQETEAYILDKAADFRVDLSVEVTVKEKLPVAAQLDGSISPYIRSKLEAILESDLGIKKENQIWM